MTYEKVELSKQYHMFKLPDVSILHCAHSIFFWVKRVNTENPKNKLLGFLMLNQEKKAKSTKTSKYMNTKSHFTNQRIMLRKTS